MAGVLMRIIIAAGIGLGIGLLVLAFMLSKQPTQPTYYCAAGAEAGVVAVSTAQGEFTCPEGWHIVQNVGN